MSAERASKRTAETKAAHLQRDLERAKAALRESRQEAAAAGREVGELRKQLAAAQRELDRAKHAQGAPRLPVVIEAPAFAELQTQLDAASRESDRLGIEKAKTERELRQTTVILDQQKRMTGRLQARLARSPWAESGPHAFAITLPFEYRGLGGVCRLKSGYEVTIPANVVNRLGLVHGDTICLTMLPPGKVRLEVLARAARRTRHALVREVRPDSPEAQSRLWQAVPIRGLTTFSEDGCPGGIGPLGWIAEAEATRLGLRDGDPVTVIAPRAGEGGVPVSSPRAGLPALPTVKVLRKFEVAETTGVAAAYRQKPRRQKATAARRGHLGAARLARRPLAGLTVLVVGGDSFQVNYRQVVHGLGAKVEFVEAGGGDVDQIRARARAADVTVLITPYVGHKVKDIVLDGLAAADKEPVYVNTRGQRALFEALLGWAKKQDTPVGKPTDGAKNAEG